jgi:hypothetical protein
METNHLTHLQPSVNVRHMVLLPYIEHFYDKKNGYRNV